MSAVFTGSRSWVDRPTIIRALKGLAPGTLVIEGGAEGADRIVREMAPQLGLRVLTMKADWKRYGKAAGPIRNDEMLGHVEYGADGTPDRVEIVKAFPVSPTSRGTLDCVARAVKRGIPVCRHVQRGGAPAALTHGRVPFPVCGRAA